MVQISSFGRSVDLSYSTNVHPAETLNELIESLRNHVAPVSRAAFGQQPARVNLRLGIKQTGELLGLSEIPAEETFEKDLLDAAPTPPCQRLQQALRDQGLQVASINGFPIRDFHADRVKEEVYLPSWTDPLRGAYTFRIAKILSQIMGERTKATVSVPSGAFKGRGDGAALKRQCALNLGETALMLQRLEEATGKTITLGLEPEPFTTGETIDEFLDYFQSFILVQARAHFPVHHGIDQDRAEGIIRRFVTINLDLCHQAVEFEDPLEDLKRLRSAGIALSGLHISAALKLPDPARNVEGYKQLLAMDEPRYLHQVTACMDNQRIKRFPDLPDFVRQFGSEGLGLEGIRELRCHFHVPLFVAFDGALQSTRDQVEPAARFAAREGMTDNMVVETYTWGVLNKLAKEGNLTARQIAGDSGIDVNAGLVRELNWARALFENPS